MPALALEMLHTQVDPAQQILFCIYVNQLFFSKAQTLL